MVSIVKAMADQTIITQSNAEQNVGGNSPEGQAPGAEAQSQPVAFNIASLEGVDDDTRLKVLNKVLGKNYKDLKEIIPAEQPSTEQIEAQKEEKRKKAHSWAIQNGKITTEQIERVGAVKSKQDRDIALELFAQDIREDNPKAKDDEIEELFRSHYSEDLDETDLMRKASLKRMSKEVAAYRKEVTKGYDGIESEYDQTEQSAAQYGAYKSTVKAVTKEIPDELEFQIPFTSSVDQQPHTFSYKYPIEDKIKEVIRKEYENENVYKVIGASVKPEDLKNEIMGAVYSRVFNAAMTELLTQHAVAVETHTLAKAKAIPVTGASNFVQPTKSETQKKPPVHSNFMKAWGGVK